MNIPNIYCNICLLRLNLHRSKEHSLDLVFTDGYGFGEQELTRDYHGLTTEHICDGCVKIVARRVTEAESIYKPLTPPVELKPGEVLIKGGKTSEKTNAAAVAFGAAALALACPICGGHHLQLAKTDYPGFYWCEKGHGWNPETKEVVN